MTGETAADLVRLARERNRWQQQELAQRLGVSKSAVSAWESGRHPPRQKHIYELARLAGEDPGPALVAAGHEHWNPSPPTYDGIIQPVVELLQQMTPEEQRQYALLLVQSAWQLAMDSRESTE